MSVSLILYKQGVGQVVLIEKSYIPRSLIIRSHRFIRILWDT